MVNIWENPWRPGSPSELESLYAAGDVRLYLRKILAPDTNRAAYAKILGVTFSTFNRSPKVRLPGGREVKGRMVSEL